MGRIGHKPQQKQNEYQHQQEAQRQFDLLLKSKKRKGYTLGSGETWPESYQEQGCPICQTLQSPDPELLLTQLHYSDLSLFNIQEQSCLCAVFRHHIPNLFHLDSASQMGFLAELRKYHTVLDQLQGERAFHLWFPAGHHLLACFSPATQKATDWLETLEAKEFMFKLENGSKNVQNLQIQQENNKQLNLLDLLK